MAVVHGTPLPKNQQNQRKSIRYHSFAERCFYDDENLRKRRNVISAFIHYSHTAAHVG